MRLIVRRLERPLVSTLKAIVLARTDRHLESFAGHVLQTTTAGAIESWPAQRFAVTTAVTDAQPAVLPQFPGGAEATGRVHVSTEATSTDRPNARRRAKDADLRKSL